jgi:hypothetical protein
MCARLGIRIVGAHSPQAKGRVERNNGVHQDRLVKKFRRQGIHEDDAANAYMETHYLPALNRRFAKNAAQPQDYHRPCPSSAELDRVFRLQSERWVSNDWVVRHQNRYLQLQPTRRQRRSPRAKAVLYESEQGALEMCYRGETMAFTELSGPPPRAQEVEQEATVHVRCWQRRYRPGPESPYKRHAGENIKRVRRRLLAKAVAARRAGKGACVPPGAAKNAAPGCTPAPFPEPPSDLNQGAILIEVREGHFKRGLTHHFYFLVHILMAIVESRTEFTSHTSAGATDSQFLHSVMRRNDSRGPASHIRELSHCTSIPRTAFAPVLGSHQDVGKPSPPIRVPQREIVGEKK